MRSSSSLSREKRIGFELTPPPLVGLGLRSLISSGEDPTAAAPALGFSGSGETLLLRELSLRG